MIKKIISLLVCVSLVASQPCLAQVAGTLDISGYFAGLRNSFTQDTFRPLHLRYLQYLPQDNSFKLLIDKGDFFKEVVPSGRAGLNLPYPGLEDAAKELMRYFFIGLTLPNDAFWVNLRPDSPDNIIDDSLAQTDIGRILLEADLQLKKDTAAATSPATSEGRQYWNAIYKKSGELFGSQNVTIPTLIRPWIVPDEVIVSESESGAYIYKATLKVMLEQDYFVKSQISNYNIYQFKDPRLKELNEYSTQLIKKAIIPKLTKEINSSKRYAPLRQVYYSLILAQWFKARAKKLFPKETVSEIADSRNLTGLSSKDPYSKSTYFQAYQQSFKDGAYNLQESVYTPYGQTIRSYFSGGGDLTAIPIRPIVGSSNLTPEVSHNLALSAAGLPGDMVVAAPWDKTGSASNSNKNGRLSVVDLEPKSLRQGLLLMREMIEDKLREITVAKRERPLLMAICGRPSSGKNFITDYISAYRFGLWEGELRVFEHDSPSSMAIFDMIMKVRHLKAEGKIASVTPASDIKVIIVQGYNTIPEWAYDNHPDLVIEFYNPDEVMREKNITKRGWGEEHTEQLIQAPRIQYDKIDLIIDTSSELSPGLARELLGSFGGVTPVSVNPNIQRDLERTQEATSDGWSGIRDEAQPAQESGAAGRPDAGQGAAGKSGLGGIDLRAVPIMTRAMSHIRSREGFPATLSYGGRDHAIYGVGVRGNLSYYEQDWLEIQRLLRAGIIPSTERIKEYLASCCSRQDAGQEMGKAFSCIAEIMRLEEGRCSPADAGLKDALVALMSGGAP